MKNKIIYIFILLLAFTNTYGQEKQKEYRTEIAFALGSSVLDTELGANKTTLASFMQNINKLIQDNTVTIEKIIITSKASPEGGVTFNKKLAKKRSNSVIAHLNEHINIPKSLLVINNIGTEWKMLRGMVEESNIEKKSEILYIIDNVPEETWTKAKATDRYLTLTDSRLKHLMNLHYGIPYRQMSKELFPLMRSSSVVSVYYRRKETQTIPKEETIIKEEQEVVKPTESKKQSEPKVPTASVIPMTPLSTCEPAREKKPLFALKTNLLFDAATILNVEVEAPIKNRWSIAGEWIFPWWLAKDNGSALQVLSGNIEGKYWFGSDEKRAARPVMTGWFAGLYAGGGLYDLQYKNNGYQGEFYIAAGLSAGYAHTINKSGTLRMEYSLGLGYMKTDYRYYEGMEDNKYLVWQHDGSYTWIGPTKVKVSLVWMLHRNKRNKQ